MSYADELRARRGDPGDPFDQDAARREWGQQTRRRARREDESARRIYQEGVRQGRERSKRQHPSSKSPKSSTSSRSRRRAPASVRRGARQLVNPIRSQLASGTYTLGLVLAVIALYWLLENAGAIGGLLGGLAKALDWVASPARTIPNTGQTAAKPPGSDAQHPITTG